MIVAVTDISTCMFEFFVVIFSSFELRRACRSIELRAHELPTVSTSHWQ